MLVKRDIRPAITLVVILCSLWLGDTCFTPLQLSEPRTNACMVEVDNKIYIAGGLANGRPSAQIDIYDTTTGTWSQRWLPTARHRMTCKVVGRYIVFSHGIGERSELNHDANIFDTVSQTVTSTVFVLGFSVIRTHAAGPFVAFEYLLRFMFLDPSNSSAIPATLELQGAQGWVSNGTHLFGIVRNNQMHLHQVNLETLTVDLTPTYSMTNVGSLPTHYDLIGNQLVLFFTRNIFLFTLGQPDPVVVDTGFTPPYPLVIHESTIYIIQASTIITYHPERGTYRYAVSDQFLTDTHSTVVHNRTLYFSGSGPYIATIQIDGLLKHSDGGPFLFRNRDIGFSHEGPGVSWLNLRTQRVQQRPDINIPTNNFNRGVELQNYFVYSSGHVFEISTETWLFIENPVQALTRPFGSANFAGSMAFFGTAGMNFIVWHATDKTWRSYTANYLNFGITHSTQDKLFLIDINSGRNEIIDMTNNSSTLLINHALQPRIIVTEELVILAGGFNITTRQFIDRVLIYNARTDVVTYGQLSKAEGIQYTAQSRTHVFFMLQSSSSINVYSLLDDTWSYIDIPPHFANLPGLLLASDLQHLILQRPQRIDIYDMSTRQWRVLVGPPIEGLVTIRSKGSKLLFTAASTAVIYEITTGDWIRIDGDSLTNFQFTESFVICQNLNTTLYRPLAIMTNPMASLSKYEGQVAEFEAGLAGSLTTSLIDWRRNGVSLNVSSSNLTFQTVQQYDSGDYTITATDQCNQRVTQSATLFVVPRPLINRPLEDSISLCHTTVVVETEVKGETSLEWKINGDTQPTTTPIITLPPERLACNVRHQLCLTATNPSGSNQTCAELRLLEHDAVFDGPRPTVDRWTWFLEAQATLRIGLLDEDCTRHWWVVDGVALDAVDSRESTLIVNITTLSSYTRYSIHAKCGSSVVYSNPFTFENVSSLKVWHLALIITLIFVAVLGALITVVLFRRRLRASEDHEMELQNLLTQAKSESLTRDGVSVIPSTTWEWTPTDEFKYKPLDGLPCSISASNLHVFKNDTVKVDTWNQAEIEITLKSKGGNGDTTLKERLIDGMHVDIYTPKSPKYEVKVEPSSFTLKHGKSMLVTVSTMMRMTAKCKICLVIVIEQQHLYSILEYKIASGMSTWIDLEEVEITNDFLGGGGFGNVFRGTYRGEEVAVKKLLNQFMAEELQQEFEREITLMKDLRHPNIVQFVGASNVKDNLAILIEFAPYGSLSSVMQTSKLSYPMKLTILAETAKALQFLHLNRVIHRDIKPQNILVFSLEPKSAVHVKLTDFGTSRFISDTTMTVTKNVGTAIYMAPESLGKNPRIDKSADIYSFAILMWELLYERQPFVELEWHSEIENHVKNGGRLPLDNTLNPELIKLIEDCWKHDPAMRPSASEVVQRLAEQN